MASTTSVTILREPLFHICRDSDEDPASSGRTYKTDDLHFISLAPFVGNDIFALRFESVVSKQFLNLDGVQSRSCSISPTSPGTCN